MSVPLSYLSATKFISVKIGHSIYSQPCLNGDKLRCEVIIIFNRNQLPMEPVFQLPPKEQCASIQEEASLHLELSLEPSLDDSYCPSLTLTSSHSQAPPSPEQLPSSHPPILFDTFLQQLRRTAFKRRQGVNLKLRIARRRRTCSICQEMVVEKSVVHDLHCRHTFHRHCLQQWAKKHDSCPLCRQQLR